MGTKPGPSLNKRRFWLCLALVFCAGVLCGCFVGIGGIRYLRTHFPPPLDRISRKVASRIAKDFALDEAARGAVEREVVSLGGEIGEQMLETRKSIEALIDKRKESIGSLLPDEEAEKRWRKDYRRYFPQLPPLPDRDGPER